MQMKLSIVIAAASGIALSSAVGCATNGSAADQKTIDDLMQRRVESAETIIAEDKALEARIQKFHTAAAQQIAQANTLKGEAHVLHSNPLPLPGRIKMDAAQLKAAQDQYRANIDDFKQHAIAYQDHLKQFQVTVGECHANEAAFQRLSQQYTLHVDQFHVTMPNIRPPHVCGAMHMTNNEVVSAMNAMRSDMQRVAQSEINLAAEENRLSESSKLSAPLDQKVSLSAIRGQKEQDIFAEFGRLRTEYELLKTEKNVLASSSHTGGKVSSTTVAGMIKPRD
jgi:hypothetical protein